MPIDPFSLAKIAIGAATLAGAAYLGIARDNSGFRMRRRHYLFALLFTLFALWVGGHIVAIAGIYALKPNVENFDRSMLSVQVLVALLVGLPGLTALLRLCSQRCRDAGYSPRVAYLGTAPVLQLLFFIWLLFPRSAVPAVEASQASTRSSSNAG
jgi:uncharacterized membrane protein YhaH (DUF805 family)